MKKISILGAGESGVGAALLAKKKEADVWVSDAAKIKPDYRQILTTNHIPFEEGQHTKEKFFEADIVIKSPGIPETAPIIQTLRQAEKYIISEVEYAYQCTDAKIVAITGSNGKTTTSALTYELLKAAGLKVALGGNIGHSFARLVATQAADYYVVELSSFQLDDIDRFRPDIALLLNITSDHLDRYAYDLSKYAQAKLSIGKNQEADDLFILNIEDAVVQVEMPKYKILATHLGFGLKADETSAAHLAKGIVEVKDYGHFPQSEMQLIGKHNALNAMAALLVAKALGATAEQVRPALNAFSAIAHRLEKIAVIDGVTYINDSKATNVAAVYYALESMTQPTIWMIGGIDKGNDYDMIKTLVKEKVKSIILLGENKETFFQHFGYKPFEQVMTMEAAVELASRQAVSGDCVLLSPACSSFDLFQNYKQRGRFFKEEVIKRANEAFSESH